LPVKYVENRTMKPLISIIVLSYNSKKTILETLESIKAQTYGNIELIIADDGSKDNSIETCREWISENSGRFVRTAIITTTINTGIPANCNRGIHASNGEWIKLIAGDDLLFPNAIEIIVNEINADANNEKLAYHGKLIEFQDNPNNINFSDEWSNSENYIFNQASTTTNEQFKILLRHCPISAATAVINRTVFEKVGYFDERFKFWEDRPMWLKMTSNGIKLHFIKGFIVKYRRHAYSVQQNKKNSLFSLTVKSKDEAFKEVILPFLPIYERGLHQYVISVRGFFFAFFKNHRNFATSILYKTLVIIPEWLLNRIKRCYSY
jgi:glycosyltransferase involved in cell wall biosynthesis